MKHPVGKVILVLSILTTLLLSALAKAQAQSALIDVAFTDQAVTAKTGFAATGFTQSDFWNTYALNTPGLPNLKFVDGTVSDTGAALSGPLGGQSYTTFDPMYSFYLYAWGYMTLTVTNLATGVYDFYLYGHGDVAFQNTSFDLMVDTQSYGNEATLAGFGWTNSIWQEGVQYVEFTNVVISPGQTVTVLINPSGTFVGQISGLQMMLVGTLPQIPDIIGQPTNQIVAVGPGVSFSVNAVGSAPLAYQWLFNGANIPGATNSTYVIASAGLANAGDYSVIVANSYGSATSAVATLTVDATGATSLIDVAFNGGGPTTKAGFAGTGMTANDFWNTCSVGASDQGGSGFGATPALEFVDGTQSGAGIAASNVHVAYNDGASDPMYAWLLYNLVGDGEGDIAVTITNLTAGTYNFYIYGHGDADGLNSVFDLSAGSVDYGSQATGTSFNWMSTAWQEGWQYVEFTSVNVLAGKPVNIAVEPGGYNSIALISGLQIAYTGPSSSAPAIVAQPASQQASTNATATFTVGAGGAIPLTYEWLFNGLPLAGATNSALSLSPVTASEFGSYTVVVSNSYGAVTSSIATLSFGQAPNITAQAQNLGFTNGNSAGFSVGASGATPLYFQWYFDGATVPGGTGASLFFQSETTTNLGSYWVVVTNDFASVTSGVVTMSLSPSTQPPSINGDPANVSAPVGQLVAFQVMASGTPPLSYQWIFDGSDIANSVHFEGAQSSALLINNTQTSDQGTYQVLVSNAYGSVFSGTATLTIVQPIPPAITSQPADLTLYQGSAASFAAAASGSSLAYQWLFDGAPLANSAHVSGAQSGTLSVFNIQASDQGSYQVAVSNAFGSVVSATATLTVNPTNVGPPTILIQPVGGNISVGANGSFSATVIGAPPLSYQWLFDGTALADNGHFLGSQSNMLSIFSAQGSDAGNYSLFISNSLGAVISAVADLNVLSTNSGGPLPVITNQPISLRLVPGASGSFFTGVIAFPPATYQWFLDGSLMAGATQQTLSITNAQSANAGSYYAVISNSGGAITTLVATLTLGFPPQITSQPPSQSAVAGANLSLNVSATGTGPLTYQWQFNGPNMVGDPITTLAGNGIDGYSGDGGPATNASLNDPSSVALDSAGNLFIADTFNYRIRRLSPDGIITAVAGNGNYLYSGDGGPATNAALNAPTAVAVDGLGNLYIADSGNNRIRKVDTSGTISTVAGNGVAGYTGDGIMATAASLQHPSGVAVDSSGNLYIADTYNFRLRKVDQNGIITTIAGNGTESGFGDGGPAIDATLGPPETVSVDGAGNLYITQAYGGRVRKVDTSGIITTVAGNGYVSYNGNGGPATSAAIAPLGTGSDPLGNLFIADDDHFILKVGLNGIISIVAGIGSPAFSGDGGPATSAALNSPAAVAVDGSDDLFIADTGNNRIREVLGQALNSQGPALQLNNVTARNAGSYEVVIANAFGSITSAVATLSVGSPPQITASPTNQFVLTGSNVSITVAASGTAPLSYQWLFDGASLPGSTDATLSLAAVSTNADGSYAVIVTNAFGSATSSVATLTVADSLASLLAVPTIVVQPQGLIVVNSNSASFTVTAAGTAPLMYQWLFNGTALPGATGSNLVLASAASQDAGYYSVVVSNAYGTVASGPALLVVQVPAAIVQQPISQVAAVGSTVTLSVAATGTGPLSYSWNFNGSQVSAAPVLTLPNVSMTNVGSYAVTVANALASVNSDTVNLNVQAPGTPPAITGQPQSLNVAVGQPVTFSVAANGSPPLAYQWYDNGVALAGQTSSLLTVATSTTSNAGGYDVVVTNAYGSVTSQVAMLQIGQPPLITSEPQGFTIALGLPASFPPAVVTGTTPLSYQWLFDGTPLPGANSAGLTLASVTLANAGTYALVVNNAYGSVTSDDTVLIVAAPPLITVQPQSVAVTNGQSVALAVGATGTQPLAYQWFYNGTPLAAGTLSALAVLSAAPANAGSYTVVVTNTFGSVTSSVAMLQVGQPPFITAQPSSLTVTNGQPFTLSVSAAGTAPLAYQWLLGGAARPGATASSLDLVAGADAAGNYSVIISNLFGSATSGVAAVTVVFPPAITNQPQSLAVVAAQPASFSVGATGTPPLWNQWFYNGTALAGETSFSLTVSSVTTSNTGNYVVVITNAYGSITSQVADLEIGQRPAVTNQPQSLIVGNGQSASFAVGASGTAPLSYQWVFDGAILAGATSSSLTFSSVTPSNVGSYAVLVSNPFGLAASSLATLQIAPLLQVQGFSASSGSLTISGASGIPGATYRLLTSTDPSLPLADWTLVTPGIFDNNGNASVTASYSAGDQARFYLIASP